MTKRQVIDDDVVYETPDDKVTETDEFDFDELMTEVDAKPRSSGKRGGARGSKVWNLEGIKTLLQNKVNTIDFKTALELRNDKLAKVESIKSQPTAEKARSALNCLLWGAHTEIGKRLQQLGITAKLSEGVSYSKGNFTIDYE